MLDIYVVITILVMAAMTYFTRILGFITLKGKQINPQIKNTLQAAPPCIFISLIIPNMLSGHWYDCVTILITIISSIYFSMLPTVFISIGLAAFLRYVFI